MSSDSAIQDLNGKTQGLIAVIEQIEALREQKAAREAAEREAEIARSREMWEKWNTVTLHNLFRQLPPDSKLTFTFEWNNRTIPSTITQPLQNENTIVVRLGGGTRRFDIGLTKYADNSQSLRESLLSYDPAVPRLWLDSLRKAMQEAEAAHEDYIAAGDAWDDYFAGDAWRMLDEKLWTMREGDDALRFLFKDTGKDSKNCQTRTYLEISERDPAIYELFNSYDNAYGVDPTSSESHYSLEEYRRHHAKTPEDVSSLLIEILQAIERYLKSAVDELVNEQQAIPT